MRLPALAFFAVIAACFATDFARGEDEPAAKPAPAAPTPAERGYRAILDNAYLPAWLDQETLDGLWQVWPEAQRAKAEKASLERRRKYIRRRYGLHARPGEDSPIPLQLTPTKDGMLTLNCFACHAGDVSGTVTPGAPNTRFAYQTLSDDVRNFKLKNKKALSPFDAGGMFIPLGKTVGTTNAVVFSITLLQFRDIHLNVVAPKRPPRLPHHDLDAPPWWHYKHKRHLYYDGFGKKNARTLMQFTLVPQNKREQLEAWESDFEDISAYLTSIKPPKFPKEIDAALADQGRAIFKENCARCHGPHDDSDVYPNFIIPIGDVGTDPARFKALTREERTLYSNSWLTEYNPKGVILDPPGYVAPPLNGIWASPPYLHNGSVPTLWHLLRPSKRPKVWRRTGTDYRQVGFAIESHQAVPPEAKTAADKRMYFDTTMHGKSAAGHTYPESLSEAQREALLEYLKTL